MRATEGQGSVRYDVVVVGAQHLPLYPHEWELALTEEELKRFVERAREGREEVR